LTGDLTGRQPSAVLNALAVLEEVARAGPGVTAQQVSANLGLPRATAYRLLNLLVQDEYLVRLADLSGFALGRKVALLAGIASSLSSREEPRGILAEMRGRIRGGVHLADYRSGSLALVDVDPDFPLSDPERIAGDPACSALGRLLLAERSAPAAFAVQDGQLTPGFGCFAAAVRDETGVLVAGVALALPSARLTDHAALLGLVDIDCRRLAGAIAHAPLDWAGT
jgi:DNA-binding IclR family transcriptional regulator